MRGKVGRLENTDRRKRITPAYAGKSSHTRRCPSIDWDHPRLCGEKQASASSARNRSGSPPPMRGKAKDLTNAVAYPRITPAYAGKRFSIGWTSLLQRDHPRLCGEKGMRKKLHICFMGSPPPMREKGFATSLSIFAYGITPAYAGKSTLTNR